MLRNNLTYCTRSCLFDPLNNFSVRLCFLAVASGFWSARNLGYVFINSRVADDCQRPEEPSMVKSIEPVFLASTAPRCA